MLCSCAAESSVASRTPSSTKSEVRLVSAPALRTLDRALLVEEPLLLKVVALKGTKTCPQEVRGGMAELLAFHQVFSDRKWILLIRLFQVLRGTSVSDVSIFVGQQAKAASRMSAFRNTYSSSSEPGSALRDDRSSASKELPVPAEDRSWTSPFATRPEPRLA